MTSSAALQATGDRVAVVTGASRGIGRAVAARLARDGRRVVAVARSAPALARLATQVPGVVAHPADVALEADVEAVAEHAAALGRLDAWVSNAATLVRSPLVELDAATWDRVVAVNLRSVFLGARASLRRMTGGGTVVSLASLSGIPFVEKFPGLGAYNATKAGVVALNEMVALEGRSSGVRAVCLAPGAVATAMLREAAPHLRPRATPDDVAALVAFLLEPAAAPLSGTTIPLFTNG